MVTIGGGTGQYTLLSGLKKYNYDINAIVSMMDDGGSTGLLRDELGVLPPGDIRKCLVALSDETELLRTLFSYRFSEGSQKGHAFGNLFLSALEKITGSFSEAVKEAGRVLRIHGNVIPVTLGDARLVAHFKDGTSKVGEYVLDGDDCEDRGGLSHVSLSARVQANPEAVHAIRNADCIIIGPGGLHGSVLPCFFVDGISQAIVKSTATIVYVANLSNKKGVTDGFTIDTYVKEIEKHLLGRKIDRVIVNTQLPTLRVIDAYEKRYGAGAIVSDAFSSAKRTFTMVKADLLSDKKGLAFLRHDSEKLARVLQKVIDTSSGRGRSR